MPSFLLSREVALVVAILGMLIVGATLWATRSKIVNFFRELRTRHAAYGEEAQTAPSATRLNSTPVVLILYAICMLEIVLISFFGPGANSLFATGDHPPLFSELVVSRLIEIIMASVSILWIALSLPYRSPSALIGTIATLGVLIFSMMALVILQTVSMFVIALIIVGLIGFRELFRHMLDQPKMTAFAQTVVVLFVLSMGLYALLTLVLPGLEGQISVKLVDIAFYLRVVLGTLFVCFVLLATAINTIMVFDLHHIELVQWKPETFLLSLIASHISAIINAIYSFGLNILRFLATVGQEAYRFIRDVLIDKSLWTTLLNIVGIAAASFCLAFSIVVVKRPLALVLNSPALYVTPGRQLALSNLYIALAFFGEFVSVLLISIFWLPRRTHRSTLTTVANNVQDGAVILFLCILFATFTYFHVILPIFSWGSPLAFFPGIYTILVFVLALISLWLFQVRQPERSAK